MFKETIKECDKASVANKLIGAVLGVFALRYLKKGFKFEGAATALETVDNCIVDVKTEKN